jgi:hypothetical protein
MSDQQSESENGQVNEVVVEERVARNSQKYSKETWRNMRAEFEAGTYLSQKQLAKKYGVNFKTLTSRMVREKWNEKQRALQSKVEGIIEARVVKEVDRATSYLEKLAKRAEKYEKMLDASAENLGGKTVDGTPLVDPEMLDTLSRSELRVLEMQRTALRIIPVSQIDHTTGGKSLGESFVSAIAKLRGNPNTPKLGAEDLKRVLEAEVE